MSVSHRTAPMTRIPYASRGRRFVAYLIDTIPFSILFLAIFYVFLGFDEVLETYFRNRTDFDARLDFMEYRSWIRRYRY